MTWLIRDDAVVDEIGRRLRQVRERRGWSLPAAANHAHMSDVAIGSYERGQRQMSVSVLMRLAAAYGIPAASLLPDGPLVDPLSVEATLVALQAEVGRLVAALDVQRAVVAVDIGGAA